MPHSVRFKPNSSHTLPGVRPFLPAALALGAIALSGCGSGIKDDALGKACHRVDHALSSADLNRQTMATFGESAQRWAQGGNRATGSALAPLVASANAHATAPDAQRAQTGKQFWDEVGKLSDKCTRNGTPLIP